MYLETKENTKKLAVKKPAGLHSTTEAPEIIGNMSGKGFMRQSGPNSLSPSQIITLEEEVRTDYKLENQSFLNID